jgi:hypothetical protein
MVRKSPRSFFRNNGLSITVLCLMVVFLAGQFYMGWNYHNEELGQEGRPPLTAGEYLTSGHFIQATFENWESEFLQMALYVVLTVFLYQKGSSESKDPDKNEEVDREPKPHRNAPAPVKKGGLALKLYSSSLSLAFAFLFLISFVLHFCGSLSEQNDENAARGIPEEEWTQYISGARFWFESFQNWQSEFLAVASIVLLSIFLRQKGSPESKPVDAPHSETGGG